MRWIAAVALCLVATATAAAQDWGVRRDPFDVVVVRRYKALLARDPHDERALRELVALYKRHRTIGKLEAEYRAQLGAGEDWSTLVVLARLPRSSPAESAALWKRAVAANPADVRGWLAIGDTAISDAAAARDAYQRAAKLASAPAQKRIALTKLIGAARTVGDVASVDAAYVELIALAPKSGVLWLERGNAQLAAKQLAPALDSFKTAESLLRTDPERRLTAMLNQGVVLDALGRTDAAIAQYEHTLDKVPSGYFLGSELVQRIIDAERRRGQLPRAIERLETRWPERKRDHFEWATLGDIYKETGDADRAIEAYQRAVAKAPTEVVTQRKLIVLLDKRRPADALVQHEVAARVAPGDADLQIELAKRFHPTQPAKAFAVLDALARRMTRHVNVRSAIAALYEQWNQLPRAIREYEAIAAVEPNEPDHAIVLGDAYWRTNQADKARAAWERLDKIGTADALFRHGEVLAMHDLWDPAVTAYTRSLALDAANANAWFGRARAYDALARFPDAVEDARRAVALTAQASHADGLRNRQLLVRVLGHWYAAGDQAGLRTAVATWRFAFDRGDVVAGYMLAAHHARIGSHQQHDVLVALYRRVPADDSLGIVVARSYMRRGDYARAREELERIARRTPAREKEIAQLIAQLGDERERAEREIRLEEEGRSGRRASGRSPDLVGRRRRLGMRLGLGADVRNASSALLGLGIYRTFRIAGGTAITSRVDWMQRDDEMEEVNAVAIGGGITTRLLDARKLELAVGVAPSVEIRYGSDAGRSAWERAGLAADLTLEVLPRALPATLGLRFRHNLTDAARSSALLLELGFEVR